LIKKFKASGFRSLLDFSLEIRPGLNVLVGPNGAGKTNVIEALEFLSLLSQKPISEAVGELGGVGRIISKTSNDAYATNVQFSVEGDRLVSADKYLRVQPADIVKRQSLRGIRLAHYIYLVSVRFDSDRVFVNEESLRIWLHRVRRVGGEIQEVTGATTEQSPDYIIQQKIVDNKLTTNVRCSPLGRKFSETEYYDRLLIENMNGTGYRGGVPGDQTFLSLARNLSINFITQKFLNDLTFGSPFNVVPDRVRATMDVAAKPVLERDGYGFAATLRSLQKSPTNRRRTGPDPINRLITYVQRANPRVQKVEAEINHWESKIVAACWLGDDESTMIKIPLSALSDGTLKWLALMTAVVTGPSMFAIEEPENFVHPAVQKALVEILRERFVGGADTVGFTFLSTHSETLINALEPPEIAIVSMVEGKTVVSRPSNVSLLVSEIQRTGFGLGHYYLMGVLDE
jgi:predicted ATPase